MSGLYHSTLTAKCPAISNQFFTLAHCLYQSALIVFTGALLYTLSLTLQVVPAAYALEAPSAQSINASTVVTSPIDVSVPIGPPLSVVKTRTSTAALVGSEDAVTFEVEVSNLSGSTLGVVLLQDSYPSGCMSVTSTSLPFDNISALLGGETELQWNNIGPLAPGESRTIVATFMANVETDGFGNPLSCVHTRNRATAAILFGQASLYSASDEAEIMISDGTLETLFVGPYRLPCMGLAPTTCLQVRSSEGAPWTNLYDGIRGFQHTPGVTYQLSILKETIPNPPADASSIRYTLVEVLQESDFGAQDADGDGVSNNDEAGGPNGGDGNNDGIPDYEQANVSSNALKSGSGEVAVAVTGGCAAIQAMDAVTEAGGESTDGNYDFPLDMVALELVCEQPGQSATVDYYWYANVDDLSALTFRKYGPLTPGAPATSQWYDYPATLRVEFIEAGLLLLPVIRATVTLTDGELGDDTGLDGLIVDPGGLASGSPDVQLEKRLTTPGPYQPGMPLRYSIVITNTSGQLLTTLPLTDTYDVAYLSFDSVNGANPAPDDNSDDGQLNWSDLTEAFGDLGPGQSIEIVVHFTALQSTESAPGCSGNPGRACNTATMAAGISGTAQSQVEIRIDPLPGKSSIGDFVWHDWNGDAVQDAAEPGINGVLIHLYHDQNSNNQVDVGEFVTSTLTADDTSGAPGFYEFPSVVGNQQYIVQIDPSNFAPGRPLEGYVFSNDPGANPTVSPERGQIFQLGDPENKRDVDFALYCPFDLALVKTLKAGQSGAMQAGDNVTFTLAVINQGVVTAANISLVDYLPVGFTLSIDDANGWSSSGVTATLDLPGPLAPGVPLLVDIVLTAGPTLSGVYTNTAEIAAATDENGLHLPDRDSTFDAMNGNGTNGNGGEAGALVDDQIAESGMLPNQDEDDHDLAPIVVLPVALTPTFTLTKMLNTPEPVRTGDLVSFTIRITNTGQVSLTVLPLEDIYNSVFLTYLSAVPAPDNTQSSSLRWTNVAPSNGLAPGAVVDVLVTFSADTDSSAASVTSLCTQPGEAPNVVYVRNALADPDGAGPLPTVTVADAEACASVAIVQPTAVQLAERALLPVEEGVLLRWRTITESDIAGFHVWRFTAGNAERRSQEMIQAKVAGQSSGAHYEWLDVGATLHPDSSYLLEIVHLDGTTERSAMSEPQSTPYYLPYVAR